MSKFIIVFFVDFSLLKNELLEDDSIEDLLVNALAYVLLFKVMIQINEITQTKLIIKKFFNTVIPLLRIRISG